MYTYVYVIIIIYTRACVWMHKYTLPYTDVYTPCKLRHKKPRKTRTGLCACYTHAERSPVCHHRNFSKVRSLLNILHTMTTGLFFQKFCRFGACYSHSEGSPECHYRKFSKVSSLLNPLHTMTTWLSFEKFCRFCGCFTHSGKFSWMTNIFSNFRADF